MPILLPAQISSDRRLQHARHNHAVSSISPAERSRTEMIEESVQHDLHPVQHAIHEDDWLNEELEKSDKKHREERKRIETLKQREVLLQAIQNHSNPTEIFNCIVKLEEENQLLSIIHELWRKNKSGERFLGLFACCTGPTEAKIAFEAIQKIDGMHSASATVRATNLLRIIWDFVMKESNKTDPFAMDLTQSFNLTKLNIHHIPYCFSQDPDGSRLTI